MFRIKSILYISLALVAFFLASCTNTKQTPQSSTAANAATANVTADATAPAEAATPVPAPVEAVPAPAPVEAAPVPAPVEVAAPVEPVATPAKSTKKQSATSQTKIAPPATPDPNEIKLRSGSGNPIAGQDKAELCTGCHGEFGVSMDPLIPKLAGQYGKYIAKQVRNYQANIRTHQIMGAVAASVTDDVLADISAYFASQPMMKGDAPSSNQIGKNLFEKGDLSRMMVPCNNCHGATGKGQNPGNSTFPVIGGQHKDYLRGQILSFRKGERNNSPGGVMNIIVQKLTDAEVDALAEYISGL